MEKAGAAEGGDMGGWPLVSSAAVLSLKGRGAFMLKEELLRLRDPCHAICVERPCKEEAGAYKLTISSFKGVITSTCGELNSQRMEFLTNSLSSPSLSCLTPLRLPSKTDIGLRGGETDILTSSESHSIEGWLTAPAPSQCLRTNLTSDTSQLGTFGHMT